MKMIKEAPIPENTSPQILIKRREQIDESHPDVHDLIYEGGFDINESIEAIERYGNVSEAMDYLMSGGQEGLFESTPIILEETMHMPRGRYTEQRFIKFS